ncbi:hypothetical protein ACFYT4_18325 [Streptomyces sp. NPDC004609]|uniref:hypothetical protein n=1 Tax=Streptomyces sp. NPDC004609 TaxID=3364704 RepID=UPI0036BA1803
MDGAPAFADGKGPGIVLLGPDQISPYHANGALAPVDDALKESRDRFRRFGS